MTDLRFDSCCPMNPERRDVWVKKLQGEREQLLQETGETLGESETLLKTLAHEIRLSILHHLGTRPNCVCELVEKLGIANSALSYHLSFLAKYGLIQSINRVGNTYYVLTEYGTKVLEWLVAIPLRPAASTKV
jgi:DNA-binding transcriptional ArsR family regulator